MKKHVMTNAQRAIVNRILSNLRKLTVDIQHEHAFTVSTKRRVRLSQAHVKLMSTVRDLEATLEEFHE